MILKRLSALNFRNLLEQDLVVSPGLNALVGANAAGKTSVLEAIAFLADGQSFRTRTIQEVIAWGEKQCRVRGDLDDGGLETTQEVRLAEAKRSFWRHGRPVAGLADYLGSFSCVIFTASHLPIAHGPPEARRNFLDRALLQLYPRYLELFRRYQKILEHRNQLLRRQAPDDQLMAWTTPLIQTGSEIMRRRHEYVALLQKHAPPVHERLMNGERLSVTYRHSAARPEQASFTDALESALQRTAALERRRRVTLAGPHRDDLLLELNGHKLREFGSRGQQRTAVLALKLAEFDIFREVQGTAPLLLLDDVAAELDEARCRELLRYLLSGTQSFISAASYDKIESLLAGAKADADCALFTLAGGRVSLEGS